MNYCEFSAFTIRLSVRTLKGLLKPTTTYYRLSVTVAKPRTADGKWANSTTANISVGRIIGTMSNMTHRVCPLDLYVLSGDWSAQPEIFNPGFAFQFGPGKLTQQMNDKGEEIFVR